MIYLAVVIIVLVVYHVLGYISNGSVSVSVTNQLCNYAVINVLRDERRGSLKKKIPTLRSHHRNNSIQTIIRFKIIVLL